jgi:hypothetical protein
MILKQKNFFKQDTEESNQETLNSYTITKDDT